MSSVMNATISLLTNTNLIMNSVKMVDVHIEERKVSLPSKLDGSESDAKRDIIFYSIEGKLSGMDKEISSRRHIMALETNCNLDHK